jgi:cytoskeletal protein RodZ
MVETVGRKLQQARLRRQVSIDDASRATRIRPDKIIDLENDNYSNFPNMAYAKGFLTIYSKFLGVDVSDFAETMESTNPVAIEEYEYLNAPVEQRPVVHYAPRKQSLMPLLIIALFFIAAAIVMYVVVSFQRLGNLEQIAEKKEGGETPAPSAAIAPAVSPGVAAASPEASVEVRRAEVAPSPAASVAPATPQPTAVVTPASVSPASATVKEVMLKASKKTWVKIRKDVPDSPPVFEDWLYPDARPLRFRGTRFWIEIKDPGSVEVTRDGQPVASDQPTITIE